MIKRCKMIYEDDICRCATENCPKYNQCRRGNGFHHDAGIYTVSFLGEVCNEENNYEYFIKGIKYDE